MKKKTLLFVLPIAALIMGGCTLNIDPNGGKINPTQQEEEKKDDEGGGGDEQHTLTVDAKSLSLREGETHSIIVKFDDQIVSDDVEYKSDNDAVAEVNNLGVITAKTVGSAKITVSYLDEEATINVTVVKEDTLHEKGSLENPYTGPEAYAIAEALGDNEDNGKDVYIKGVVQEFQEEFGATYGNYSFTIEGNFICWRLLNGEAKAKFNEGDLEIGDEVLVFAKIQKFHQDASGDKPARTLNETKGGYIVDIKKPGAKEILGITRVVTAPESVNQGSTLNPADFTVEIEYEDHSKDTVTATKVEGSTTVAGEQISVTVFYKTFSITTTIKVIAGSVVKGEKTYDFREMAGFSSWSSSYGDHSEEFEDVLVNFTGFNKQSDGNPILDQPVTKNGNMTIVSKVASNTFKSVSAEFTQWNTKTKTIKVFYSTDSGTTFNETEVANITSFELASTNLPAGTNAIKFDAGADNNQVGFKLVKIDFGDDEETPTPVKKVNSVTVTPETVELTKNNSQQLQVVVAAENGAPETVTWSTSDATKVTVTDGGYITALDITTEPVTITATSTFDGTKSDVCLVTVVETQQEVNYGTLDAPITVTQALAIMNNECASSDKTKQMIYCQGEIKSIKDRFDYGAFELDLTDGENDVHVFRVHFDEGVDTQVLVGKTLKLVGFGKTRDGAVVFADGSGTEEQCRILSVTGEAKAIKSIDSVETKPTQVSVGDTIGVYDVKIGVTFVDDSTGVVYPTSVTVDTSVVAASVVATVGYGEKTTTFNVAVVSSLNYGTEASPLTVTQALAVIETDCPAGGNTTKEIMYCAGTIKSIGEVKTSYFKTVYLTDGENDILINSINMGDGVNKADFVVGAEIVLKGYGKNYNDNGTPVLEFATGPNNTYVYCISIGGGGSQEQVTVTGVTLDKTTASVEAEKTITLVATVAPSNATNKKVSWSCAPTSVATVDQTGKVTGVAEGTATVTVTTEDGSKTASCTVTVTKAQSGATTVPLEFIANADTKATACVVKVDGDEEGVSGMKCGTSSVAGQTTLVVPVGAKSLSFYIAGWKGIATKVTISGLAEDKVLDLVSDDGVTSNPPFTLVGDSDTFKQEIDFGTALTEELTLTFAATKEKRFVVWGATCIK